MDDICDFERSSWSLFLCLQIQEIHLRRIHGKGQGVFITGCDTGFGYDLAKRLDGLGFRVFAGCLNSNGKEAGELARSCSNLLHVVQLDVTKEDQITAAKAYVETVHKNTGCGLWALVNNAGIDCLVTSSFVLWSFTDVWPMSTSLGWCT